MKLLFLDTETTGLTKDHAVIQIAGIVDVDGEVKEKFNLHAAPQPADLINDQALQIQNITRDTLATYPTAFTTYGAIKRICDKYIDKYNKLDKFILAGQNCKFDYDMMESFFLKCGDKYWHSYVAYHVVDLVACTALLKLAGRINPANAKLSTVAASLNIPLEAHDAMNDIEATRQIFYRYVDMVKK